MIVLSGTIGAGKTSLTEMLADHLGSQAFYESVDDNPILPLFYENPKKYGFLLQIYFLNKRLAQIKAARAAGANNILDRSIYEDEIFMKMNTEMGNATKVEYDIYKSLLNNMMEELPYAAHKKSPDLMITIKVSYETMIKRIIKRGRDYEQIEKDPSLVDYYHRLLSHYDDWMNEYDESPLLIIDGDKYDFVADVKDRVKILETIEDKLYDLGNLEQTKVDELRKAHLEILKQQ